jgi:hypothetical protein
VVACQADIARREGVSRARVTQVLMLLRLAPEIQERILGMPKKTGPSRISERRLRPIAHMGDWEHQLTAFNAIHNAIHDTNRSCHSPASLLTQ